MPDLEQKEEDEKKMRNSFVLLTIPVRYHSGGHPLSDPDAANFDAYVASVLRFLYAQSGHHLDVKAGDVMAGTGTEISVGIHTENAGPERDMRASNLPWVYGGGAPAPREMAEDGNLGLSHEDEGDLEIVADLISRINVEVTKADANLQDAVATLKRIEEI